MEKNRTDKGKLNKDIASVNIMLKATARGPNPMGQPLYQHLDNIYNLSIEAEPLLTKYDLIVMLRAIQTEFQGLRDAMH